MATRKDNGIPTAPLKDEDTDRITRSLHAEIVASNPGGMDDGKEVLRQLAHLIKSDGQPSGSSGSSGGGGRGKFLGLEIGDWAKQLLTLIVAALVALGAWQLTIRDELSKRPTAPQVQHTVDQDFKYHNDSESAHPVLQSRITDLSKVQVEIQKSQAAQAKSSEAQAKSLEAIQRDLSRISRHQ